MNPMPRIYTRLTLAERFWPKVDKSGDCWSWLGARNRKGYGTIGLGGKHGKCTPAPRAAWLLTRGPIPDGLLVCHRCDNPTCVRPEHLFLGTALENTHDMISKGRARHRPLRGESNRRALLTDEKVRYIRAERGNGRTLASLAAELGVHLTTVHYASNGKNWRHV